MVDGKVLKEDWKEFSIGAFIGIRPIFGAKALKAMNEEAKQFINDSKIGGMGWKVKK